MKRLLSVIICLMALTGAVAETHYKPKVSIGARAGLSMAQMSFSPSVKQSWNYGTTGAVTFRYTEEKIFGLIAELGWVQRGWAENFEEHPFSYSRSITYVNLPLLTHIYFGAPRAKAFFNLGPQIAFLLGNSIKADFDYNNPTSVPGFPSRRMTQQMSDKITGKFDYGICAGAGGEFYLTPRNSLLVEARFYYGLGNIFPSAKADTFGASRNMSLEICLGYFFRIK